MSQWLLNEKGFYWTENGPPEEPPTLVFEWFDDKTGHLILLSDSEPIPCNATTTSLMVQYATKLLLHDGSFEILLEDSRILLARNGVKFGIQYLTNLRTSIRRQSLTIIDLVQLIDQLLPPRIDLIDGENTQLIISAPHAPSESKCAVLVKRLARALNCHGIIAWGYRDRGDRFIPHPIGRCINVNRPTEFVRSSANSKLEIRTDRALSVYKKYLKAMEFAVGRLPVPLLVELHGFNRRRKHPFDIEIATTGFTDSQIQLLQSVLSEQLSIMIPDFQITFVIEPLQNLTYNAQSTKDAGSLQPTVASCALHIELSDQLRRESLDGLTQVLQNWFNMVLQTI